MFRVAPDAALVIAIMLARIVHRGVAPFGQAALTVLARVGLRASGARTIAGVCYAGRSSGGSTSGKEAGRALLDSTGVPSLAV